MKRGIKVLIEPYWNVNKIASSALSTPNEF